VLEDPFTGSPEAEVAGIWKFSVDGKIPTGDIKFTDGGKVEFKPNGKPYGDKEGSWKITKDTLVAKFNKFVLTMIKDQNTGGWVIKDPAPGKPRTGLFDGRLKHVTKSKTKVMGKWRWMKAGKYVGQIALMKKGVLKYRDLGRQFRKVGTWKIRFGIITLRFYKTTYTFTFNRRTGWKCKACDIKVHTPTLTHDPFFGQPEATFLGQWKIKVGGKITTVKMNDDETISTKTEGFDWSVGKGKWTFTGKEIKFTVNG
jgi:hypothetical protein